MLKRLLAIASGLALSLSVAQAAPAPAQVNMNMFKGKTITYIVSTGPGGGYDTYGRLMARYMQKYLPGSRFLVRNVPGAGHIVGANTIYASRPDGLTIGTFNTGLIYDQLLQRPGVKFDLSKFSYIGKASSDTRVVVISTTSGFKTFDDMMKSKTPVKFAASGIGSAAYIETRIIQNALHLNLQIVPGFDGSEGEMSMLRSEVVAEVGTSTSLDQFVRNGHGYFALSLSEAHSLPGVPSASQYAKDDRARKLLGLVSTLSDIGRLTAAPPGVPANILETLRAAEAAAVRDPEFLAEAKKLDLPVVPAGGAVVAQKIKDALAQPPETITFLKSAAST